MAQVTEFRMKLSDRMQAIADRIEPGETVADIGTDHGQIPVWLFARGICPRAILTDISGGSLAKAKETAAAYQFGQNLSFREGNGLTVLKPGEADAVIIAGMGGKLIRQIMAENLPLTLSFRKFILQPRKGYGHLRKWLLEQGFLFTGEEIVRESHFLPEIITVISPAFQECVPGERDSGTGEDGNCSQPLDLAAEDRGELADLPEDDIRLRVPPWMIRARGPLQDYFDLRIGQERLKLDNMRRAKARNRDTEEEIENSIAYLEQLKRTYKESPWKQGI